MLFAAPLLRAPSVNGEQCIPGRAVDRSRRICRRSAVFEEQLDKYGNRRLAGDHRFGGTIYTPVAPPSATPHASVRRCTGAETSDEVYAKKDSWAVRDQDGQVMLGFIPALCSAIRGNFASRAGNGGKRLGETLDPARNKAHVLSLALWGSLEGETPDTAICQVLPDRNGTIHPQPLRPR